MQRIEGTGERQRVNKVVGSNEHATARTANGDRASRERVRAGLRGWFRTPPRQHGEVEYSRDVSFLELFYDLVYVVAISQAAKHLALHVDARSAWDFFTVFGLIWMAWFNGTMWHEMHGREDGRSRNNIFLQMGLVVLLAVFASGATEADGTKFAVTYAVLFAWFTWQWYVVRRIDEDPRYRPTTGRYIGVMIATITPIAISATLNVTARRWIWGVVVILWLIGGIRSLASDNTEGFGQGVTASLVERFGLLTIIVLGEVVVGVVNGINDAPDRDALTIGVGLAGLTIGMGIWWTYFDLLGGRVPGQRGMRLAVWLFAHLPLTMAIAASGAAIVSLVEHAHARRTPADTAWLLGISIVVVLIGIAAANLALPEDAFPPGMARQIAPVLGGAGILVLAVVAVRPAPLVLALVIDLTLMLGWLWLLVVFLARGGVPYGQVADSDAA